MPFTDLMHLTGLQARARFCEENGHHGASASQLLSAQVIFAVTNSQSNSKLKRWNEIDIHNCVWFVGKQESRNRNVEHVVWVSESWVGKVTFIDSLAFNILQRIKMVLLLIQDFSKQSSLTLSTLAPFASFAQELWNLATKNLKVRPNKSKCWRCDPWKSAGSLCGMFTNKNRSLPKRQKHRLL